MRVFLVNGIRCFTNEQLADVVAHASSPINVVVTEMNPLHASLVQLQQAFRDRRKIECIRQIRNLVHKDANGYPCLSLYEAKCIADAFFNDISA